jgi:uncharacterized protein
MQINYPFHFDNNGRTSRCSSYEVHIRNMIEQILFTSPGERVNRPDFGCGVRQLLFLQNSEALATATQFLIQGALQLEMGNLIQIEAVDVQNIEASLVVEVSYTVIRTQQHTVETFVQGV